MASTPNQATGPGGRTIYVSGQGTASPSINTAAANRSGRELILRPPQDSAQMGGAPDRAPRPDAGSNGLRSAVTWANNALDKAGKAYTGATRDLSAGFRDAAASPLGKAVSKLGTGFGIYSAAVDGSDAYTKLTADRPDVVGGINSATKATAGTLMAQPFLPGKAVGASMYAGNAVGSAIHDQANKTETGRGVLDWIGSKLNVGGPSRDQLDEVNRRIAAGQPLGDLAKYAGSSGAAYEAAMQAKANGTRVPPPDVPAPKGEMGPQPRVNPNQATNDAKLAAASKLDPGNVIMRQGNNFSGENIKQGFRYAGDGADWETSGRGITSMPAKAFTGGSPNVANVLAGNTPDFLSNEPMSLRSGGGASAGGPGFSFSGTGATMVNAGGGGVGNARADGMTSARRDELRKEFERLKDTSTIFARSGRERREKQAQQAAYNNMLAEKYLGALGGELVSDGEDRRAGLRANVDVRGQDITMRGQDLDYGARMSASQMAAMRAGRESDDKTWERNFKMLERQDKLGAQTIEQRAAREKSIQSLLEGMHTTQGENGPVVDSGAVAQSMQALHRSAARAGLGGLHEMEPRALQELMTANKLLTRLRNDSSGILGSLFGPNALATIDPIDLTNMQRLENGDRLLRSKNEKVDGKRIPARYFETEEAHRFDLWGARGTPTSEYDILSGN